MCRALGNLVCAQLKQVPSQVLGVWLAMLIMSVAKDDDANNNNLFNNNDISSSFDKALLLFRLQD